MVKLVYWECRRLSELTSLKSLRYVVLTIIFSKPPSRIKWEIICTVTNARTDFRLTVLNGTGFFFRMGQCWENLVKGQDRKFKYVLAPNLPKLLFHFQVHFLESKQYEGWTHKTSVNLNYQQYATFVLVIEPKWSGI